MITRDDINQAINEANSFTKKNVAVPSSPVQPAPAAPALAQPQAPSPYFPENSLQEVGAGLGMEMPSTEELKGMSLTQKIGRIGGQVATFPVRLALGLPKAIVQMLPNFVVQGSKPIQALMEGKPLDLESLSKMENPQLSDLPLINALPGSVKGFIDKYIQPEGDYYGLAAQGGKEAEYFSKYAGLPAPLAKFVGGLWSAGSIASQAFADVAVTASMADTMKNALQPRNKLVEGKVANTEPIKNAITTENGKTVYRAPETESPSQYYSLSKDFATGKGGTEKNTFWKVAPSTGGSVELSLVRLVDQKAGPTIDINGMPISVTKGKFGNEIKIQSEVLKKPAMVGGEVAAPKVEPGAARSVRDIVSEKFNDELIQLEALRVAVEENPLKALQKYTSKTGQNKGVLPEVSGTATKGKFATKGDVIAQDAYGYRATDVETPYLEDIRAKFEDWQAQKTRLKTMEGELKERIKNEKFELKDQEVVNKFLGKEGASFEEAFGPVPKKPAGREAGITAPVRGMENKLVSQTEIDSIDRVARITGVDSKMTEAIMRNLTGKTIASDLTKMEAYNVMKQLSEFDSPFIKEIPTTWFDRWTSAPRHWTSRYQEKTGIPISDSWQRLEGADMFTKTKVYEAESVIKDIWGNYLKNSEARTAVRAYRLGDEASILENSLFTSAQKTDLISIASKVDEFYKILGPEVGVPLEVFLQGPYSPEVQALGGKFTLYKEKGKISAPYDITLESGEKVPGSSFFAKKKRYGSISEVINDEAELMNIYARAGYKHKFFDPAVKAASELLEKLPDEGLKNHWASMVQEKMGYGGVIEKFMNDTVPKYLEKIPFVGDKLNLPADFARQFMNYSLGWVSANVMSQPATWFRDFLSYPTLGYAQMGPRFMGSAMTDFMIPSKRAAMWKNAKNRGFVLERGLSAEVEFRGSGEVLGGKVGRAYSKITEAAVAPKSWADNVTRVLIVDQSQKIFNEALARYNKNPTPAMWTKFEADTGLKGFLSADKNAIRQSLVGGDIEGALNRYIRTNIDDSVWPYRQASSGRVFYGAGGKLGGFLLKWPFEYVSAIGSWVRNGQWDKIVRLYGSVHALNETFKKEYGWDFSKSFLLGPVLGIGLSPLPKMAWNFLTGGINALQGNLDALDQNKDQIMQTFQAAVRPGGVMRKNIESLYKSYQAYKNGIVGPNDTLPVFNTRGQVLYYDKFSNLFWRLWGFPTETMVGHSQLRSKERKESALRNIRMADVRENILDLLRSGDTQKLNTYVQGLVANGIKPPTIDTKSLLIPLDYRLFQQMTPEAKSIFGPQVEKLYAQ